MGTRTQRQVTCCCAEGRCKKYIRKFYPVDFPCNDFRKLVKEGKNPTNCPYYNHMLDGWDIGHNKKSGKGEKRKRQVEQKKAREAKRKEKANR